MPLPATPERIKQIRRLAARGWSADRIHKRLRTDHRTIYKYAADLMVAHQKPFDSKSEEIYQWRWTMSWAAVAEKLGWSKSLHGLVSKYKLARMRLYLKRMTSPTRDERMREDIWKVYRLTEMGWSVTEIAPVVRMSERNVVRVRGYPQRLNLPQLDLLDNLVAQGHSWFAINRKYKMAPTIIDLEIMWMEHQDRQRDLDDLIQARSEGHQRRT